MTDDKTKRGAPDRSRVSGSEQYEVDYFAKRHRISPDDARRIIADAGPSRAKADEAAKQIGKAGHDMQPGN
jgi:hypothetical protein